MVNKKKLFTLNTLNKSVSDFLEGLLTGRDGVEAEWEIGLEDACTGLTGGDVFLVVELERFEEDDALIRAN